MSTIPVSEVVRVTPGVLPAGGSALDLSGLVLTTSTRPPIDAVLTFSSDTAVANYFGAETVEARMAQKYFAGFDNSNRKPGAMLFAQYPLAAVGAFLRGGSLEDLTLTELQAFSGTLSVTINSVLKSASVNLSGATSFTNAAALIADALVIAGPQAGTITGAPMRDQRSGGCGIRENFDRLCLRSTARRMHACRRSHRTRRGVHEKTLRTRCWHQSRRRHPQLLRRVAVRPSRRHRPWNQRHRNHRRAGASGDGW